MSANELTVHQTRFGTLVDMMVAKFREYPNLKVVEENRDMQQNGCVLKLCFTLNDKTYRGYLNVTCTSRTRNVYSIALGLNSPSVFLTKFNKGSFVLRRDATYSNCVIHINLKAVNDRLALIFANHDELVSVQTERQNNVDMVRNRIAENNKMLLDSNLVRDDYVNRLTTNPRNDFEINIADMYVKSNQRADSYRVQTNLNLAELKAVNELLAKMRAE